jgi:cellulose synthase/poly-beta-1,6-N-acetylglucosamine synthase-like glycosyltransferase
MRAEYRRLLKLLPLALSIYVVLALFVLLMPSFLTWLSLLSALSLTIYFLLLLRFRSERWLRRGSRIPSLFSIALISLPFIFGFVAALEAYEVGASLALIVVATGLTITFWSSFLAVPLAVYHKCLESLDEASPIYPTLSVIVPAYNEEKVVARAIEALLEADYPSKEIIVVDDGSTDRTLAIASSYKGVKVLHKPNGGKYSALNFGLRFARGEIVVTVDADSIVGRDALKEIVKRFRDPKVAAVCGNIKVLNRVNWLTRCQALEYVTSINIFRRALDVFGAVTVVPGALGAFRRGVLEAGGLYDRDTLAEDFDVTVKTLKSGSIVQASSYAVAYTEAPQTLKDLYRQRMRWYRGNFQTIFKHRDAFTNPRYGFLQRLGFPFILISMGFIPFAGVAVWASAAIAILNGAYTYIASTLLLFTALQTLLSLLAIEIDEEDPRLVAYAPFFVVGYKHLIDAFTIKALFDILLKRRVNWTRAERIGQIRKQ